MQFFSKDLKFQNNQHKFRVQKTCSKNISNSSPNKSSIIYEIFHQYAHYFIALMKHSFIACDLYLYKGVYL